LKLAVVYNRPVTELYADLYRQIQVEVGIAKAKAQVANRAHVSAPNL